FAYPTFKNMGVPAQLYLSPKVSVGILDKLHDKNSPKNQATGHPLFFPVSAQTRISRLWL
ncbi:hypothetical protein, partial [Aeromonas dhakensis]|uniref:hypothetical protein n=1 Tax=Aeromonas dhakensis TaxID=196024 RepID=UPI00300E3A14